MVVVATERWRGPAAAAAVDRFSTAAAAADIAAAPPTHSTAQTGHSDFGQSLSHQFQTHGHGRRQNAAPQQAHEAQAATEGVVIPREAEPGAEKHRGCGHFERNSPDRRRSLQHRLLCHHQPEETH